MALSIPSHFSNVPCLNIKQLVDTTLWLKSWLKIHLFLFLLVLATTNSKPGLTLKGLSVENSHEHSTTFLAPLLLTLNVINQFNH